MDRHLIVEVRHGNIYRGKRRPVLADASESLMSLLLLPKFDETQNIRSCSSARNAALHVTLHCMLGRYIM